MGTFISAMVAVSDVCGWILLGGILDALARQENELRGTKKGYGRMVSAVTPRYLLL